MSGSADVDTGLLKLDYQKAREQAIRLFALSTATFPSTWQQFTNSMLVDEISGFALHARRVVQCFPDSAFENEDASWNPYELTVQSEGGLQKEGVGEKLQFLSSFRFCINRIVHAKNLAVGLSPSDRIWDKKSGPIIAPYVVVKSNNFDYDNISIPGVSKVFLGPVAHRVVTDFPFVT